MYDFLGFSFLICLRDGPLFLPICRNCSFLYVVLFGSVYFPDFSWLFQVCFCCHGLYPGCCDGLLYLLRYVLRDVLSAKDRPPRPFRAIDAPYGICWRIDLVFAVVLVDPVRSEYVMVVLTSAFRIRILVLTAAALFVEIGSLS